jgi:hypothetical protein
MLVHLVLRRMMRMRMRLLLLMMLLSLGHEQPRAAIVRVGGTRIVVVVPQRPPSGRGRRRRRCTGACTGSFGSTVRRLLGILPRSGVGGLLLLAVVPSVRVHGTSKTVSISASRSSGAMPEVREGQEEDGADLSLLPNYLPF